MREILIAAGLFLALSFVAIGARSASWEFIFYAGGFLVVGGLAFSLPCAFLYHLQLYRALAPRGALERRWLWNPTGHHRRLEGDERRRVLPWFYAGAAGWAAAMLGCAMVAFAAITAR